MHTVIWYQVFRSTTNNLHTVEWFQLILSNRHNYFYLIIVISFSTQFLIWFWLHGISNIVDYLMPNTVYMYILKWFINIFLITFFNEPKFIFCTQLNGFKHCYLIWTIPFTIICLLTVKWFQVLLCNRNSLTSVLCLHTFK